jgi:hypothetical protein
LKERDKGSGMKDKQIADGVSFEAENVSVSSPSNLDGSDDTFGTKSIRIDGASSLSTGRGNVGTKSLFADSVSSRPPSFSGPNNDENIDLERQREMNLVGRFEQTIFIQAAFVVVAFFIVIGVGITGGITDGSDRYIGDADEYDDNFVNRYNDNVPEIIFDRSIPTDTSSVERTSSIWL